MAKSVEERSKEEEERVLYKLRDLPLLPKTTLFHPQRSAAWKNLLL
jgi:hypothetical protein